MFADLPSTSRRAVLFSAIASAAVAASVAHAAAPLHANTVSLKANRAQIAYDYGKLPLRFEANQGQVNSEVRFLSRGAHYGLFLTGKEAVLMLSTSAKESPGKVAETDVLRMQLMNSNGASEPAGVEQLPGVSNYLIGSDPAQWHTGIPNYSRVRYDAVYPGIDLVYYGNQRQLEYDFVVAPGADPSKIRLRYAGATGLELDSAGNLVISAPGGTIAFHKPVVYQNKGGRRVSVDGRFVVHADNSTSFAVGHYDAAEPLVIDPTLVYSTFLGGSNGEAVSAIAVDSSSNAYLIGTTFSTDFPVTPGVVKSKNTDGRGIVFVSKLNASGSALIYSTFVGGSGSPSGGDTGEAIALDSSGDAYITGSTYSSDFPTTAGAFQTTKASGANGGPAAFVTKINPTGTKLVYSTFLGGNSTDVGTSIAIDSSSDAYVAGITFSTTFPVTTGVLQTTNNSAPHGSGTAFVTKLNPTAASLLYSTYLGGSNDFQAVNGIVRLAVDSSGDAFVTSSSYATDFPVTAGAYQTKNKGKAGVDSNLTLSKLNPTATKLLYSTYIGGTGSSYHGDQANGLAIDSAGNAYLTGATYEADYPVTSGAFQKTNNAAGSQLTTGYVTKMNAAGSALVYSTYLGGSGGAHGDGAYGLAIDSSGDAYITGSAGSTDFPVTSNAFQNSNLAEFNEGSVVFLTELNPAGSALVYSTYFGGANSYDDIGYGVALGSSGNVYFAGATGASDFPISSGAFQLNYAAQNGSTGFVSEITFSTVPTTLPTIATLTSNANPAFLGNKVTFSVSVIPKTGNAIPTGNVVFSIDQVNVATVALSSTGFANYSTTALGYGAHAILASYAGNSTYTNSGSGITETIEIHPPTIQPASGVYSAAQLITLSDATAGTTIYYTTDGTAPTTSSTKYTAPFIVNTAEFVQAIAVLSGAPNSNVTAAYYTLITAPTVLAVPASSITTTTAKLNGLLTTYGMAGSYYFQYGTSSTSLTSSTPRTALPSSSFGNRLTFAPMPVTAAITGLTSKKTYYYQVVVTTPAGTSSGTVLSFTMN